MILITRIPTGLLVQKDDAELIIDDAAIPAALPLIIRELIGSGQAVAQARRQGYEDGLQDGRARGMIETEAKYRALEQRMLEMDEQLALKVVRVHMSA